jgi:hypothetical protein
MYGSIPVERGPVDAQVDGIGTLRNYVV